MRGSTGAELSPDHVEVPILDEGVDVLLDPGGHGLGIRVAAEGLVAVSKAPNRGRLRLGQRGGRRQSSATRSQDVRIKLDFVLVQRGLVATGCRSTLNEDAIIDEVSLGFARGSGLKPDPSWDPLLLPEE